MKGLLSRRPYKKPSVHNLKLWNMLHTGCKTKSILSHFYFYLNRLLVRFIEELSTAVMS